MQTIHFARHGKTSANEHNEHQSSNRHFGGQADSPLSSKGEQQAIALGKQYRERGVLFTRALASPLSRARKTAAILLESMGLNLEIEERPELLERSLGPLEGRNVQDLLEDDDFMRQHPAIREHLARDADLRHLRETFEPSGIAGVESYEDVTMRLQSSMPEIFTAEHVLEESGDILIVSHKHTLRCAAALLLRLEPKQTLVLDVPNATPIIVQRTREKMWRLVEGLTIPCAASAFLESEERAA